MPVGICNCPPLRAFDKDSGSDDRLSGTVEYYSGNLERSALAFLFLFAQHNLVTADFVGNRESFENVVKNEFNALVFCFDAHEGVFAREHIAVEEAVLAFVLQCRKGFRERNVLEADTYLAIQRSRTKQCAEEQGNGYKSCFHYSVIVCCLRYCLLSVVSFPFLSGNGFVCGLLFPQFQSVTLSGVC